MDYKNIGQELPVSKKALFLRLVHVSNKFGNN